MAKNRRSSTGKSIPNPEKDLLGFIDCEIDAMRRIGKHMARLKPDRLRSLIEALGMDRKALAPEVLKVVPRPKTPAELATTGKRRGHVAELKKGVRYQSIYSLENSEALGVASIGALSRIADALGFDFVYYMVPKSTTARAMKASLDKKAKMAKKAALNEAVADSTWALDPNYRKEGAEKSRIPASIRRERIRRMRAQANGDLPS